MSKEVKVLSLPNCNFCGQVANYDGETILGSAWANMCQPCFETLGKGLGLGLGQRLVLSK